MKTIFKCTFTLEQVEATNMTDINTAILSYVLHQHRAKIVKAIEKEYPTIQSIEHEYEGGIDTWFGPGSVMLYELGLALRFTLGPEEGCVFEMLA